MKRGVKTIKNRSSRKDIMSGNTSAIYEVVVGGEDGNGLVFSVGEKYRILERDGEAVLIEKLGDSNNPYYVSRDFLIVISEEKAKEFLK